MMNRFLPDNLALHNQDLTDVMLLVDGNTHSVARAIYRIALQGHIHSLDEKHLEQTRKSGSLCATGNVLFPGRGESPFLTDTPLFESLPDILQIKTILWRDFETINDVDLDEEMTDAPDSNVVISDAENVDADMADVEVMDIDAADGEETDDEDSDIDESPYYFEPTLGSPRADARAAQNLLQNIDNPTYRQQGSISKMRSTTLEKAPSKMASLKSEGFLHRTKLKVDVSPADDFSGMMYQEQYHMSTLLTGQKIWLVYPPILENRGKVLKIFEDIAAGQVPSPIFSHLEHGIAIIQNPGQTVAIPPLWAFAQFCTKTSVSCSYSIETARPFHKRFENGNAMLFLASTRIFSNDEEQEQAKLLRYVADMVDYLEWILNNSIEDFNSQYAVMEICRNYAHIYRSFVRVLAAITDKPQVNQLKQDFQQIWMGFVADKAKKKPECRICHQTINTMPGGGAAVDRLKQHFLYTHCDDSQ